VTGTSYLTTAEASFFTGLTSSSDAKASSKSAAIYAASSGAITGSIVLASSFLTGLTSSSEANASSKSAAIYAASSGAITGSGVGSATFVGNSVDA